MWPPPPGNHTGWDGMDLNLIKEYVWDMILLDLMWKPEKCLVVYPFEVETMTPDAARARQKLLTKIVPTHMIRDTARTTSRLERAARHVRDSVITSGWTPSFKLEASSS